MLNFVTHTLTNCIIPPIVQSSPKVVARTHIRPFLYDMYIQCTYHIFVICTHTYLSTWLVCAVFAWPLHGQVPCQVQNTFKIGWIKTMKKLTGPLSRYCHLKIRGPMVPCLKATYINFQFHAHWIEENPSFPMVCLSCSNSFLIMRCRRTSEAWSAARIRTMRVHHIFLRMEKTKNHQSQKNRHVFDLRMTHLLSGIFWWLTYRWKAHLLWYTAICIAPIGPLRSSLSHGTREFRVLSFSHSCHETRFRNLYWS